MPWAALIAMVPSIVGAVSAGQASASQMAMAREILKRADEEFGALAKDIPEIADLEAAVSKAQMPERSAVEDIAPERGDLSAAQDESIAQLGEWAKPGVTDQERFMMSRALGEIQRRNAADRASLSREAGGLDSGQALAMAERAQSQNAQREGDLALGLNAQAQARALSALRDRYQAAQGRSSNLYGRDLERARAKDAIGEANARFAIDKAGALGALRQRRFANQYDIAAGRTGNAQARSNAEMAFGQQEAGRQAGTGAALTKATYSWLNDDDDKKSGGW